MREATTFEEEEGLTASDEPKELTGLSRLDFGYVQPWHDLTSLSRRGGIPSLNVRGKESGKWQGGRVTRLDNEHRIDPRRQ
ncbi:hypothetical protein CRG98_001133 [Punica granatum]|uniref:Uncharacterized protein n=1 Tax=Punica granatum TaxID=22663 RepID=A0A2I0LCV3_PUNGR|nr:hypothetical protein CRG98_001133 [Punica granatum]